MSDLCDNVRSYLLGLHFGPFDEEVQFRESLINHWEHEGGFYIRHTAHWLGCRYLAWATEMEREVLKLRRWEDQLDEVLGMLMSLKFF